MSRLDRINQQIKREIGLILQRELNDPRLQFVSIMSVSTSPDLRNAKVYFSVLGDPSSVDKALTALEGASGMVRKLIGQRVTMRYTPQITFYHDDSIEVGARMDKVFKEIHDADQENLSSH